ncbi:hypothetical protein BJI64_02820 [Acinetobacter baumannii]|nr:hypothetical protein BJI64_02820 [Acinetobacter baumannii]
MDLTLCLNEHFLFTIIAATLSTVYAAPLTKDNGAPVGDNQNSTTAGANGATLLQDVQLIQKLQRFGRERIPERVVHAPLMGAIVKAEWGIAKQLRQVDCDANAAKTGLLTAEQFAIQFGQQQRLKDIQPSTEK